VKERFYFETARHLLAVGWLRPDDNVLVVAGGESDREVLTAVGLRTVTISSLDERMHVDDFAPFRWSLQNAEALDFADGSFDVCIVHQGLHHCRSPHRGLVEMYRVARRGVVVFEPQETLLTRAGVLLGVGQQYECAAVADNDLRCGGVENSDIPNFVYRWTAREVRKTLAAYDPTGHPRVRFFYDLRVPDQAPARLRGRPSQLIAQAAVPVARVVLRLLPSQANAIAIVADKLDPGTDAHPWLANDEEGVHANTAWFDAAGHGSSRDAAATEPAL
jgi:SAM-dependent methyltransferase